MAVTVHQDFDSGNGVATAIDESTPGEVLITLAPVPTYLTGWAWFHVRIEGVEGLEVKIRFATGSDREPGQGAQYSWGVATNEGPDSDNWTRATLDSYSSGQTDVTVPTALTDNHDTIWFAMHASVTTDRVSSSVASWASSPYVSPLPGQSSILVETLPPYTGHDSRSIPALPWYAFRVTQGNMTDKRKVIWIGGNHAGEVQGWRSLEAAVTWLLGSSPEAERFRRRCTIDVFPHINPAGLYGGYDRSSPAAPSVNHNSNWHDLDLQTHPTVKLTQDTILSVHGAGSVDAWFDWHGKRTARVDGDNELWCQDSGVHATRPMHNTIIRLLEPDGYSFTDWTTSPSTVPARIWIQDNVGVPFEDRFHDGTPETTSEITGTVDEFEAFGRALAQAQQAIVAPILGDTPAEVVAKILAIAPNTRIWLCDAGLTTVEVSGDDTVTHWEDQGPAGIVATQSVEDQRPRQGYKDGTFTRAEPASLRRHIFVNSGNIRHMVLPADMVGTGAKTVFACVRRTLSTGANAIAWWRSGGQANGIYLTGSGLTRVLFDQTAGQGPVGDSPSFTTQSFANVVRAVRYNGSGSSTQANYSAWREGLPQPTNQSSNVASNTTSDGFLARRIGGTEWYFSGGYTSFAVTTDVLSDEQVEAISQILADHREYPNRETYPADPFDPGDDVDGDDANFAPWMLEAATGQ